MDVLVTGCAGFIGSHTVEALLAAGHRVRGVDAFTDNYDPALKRENLQGVIGHPAFELVDDDLVTADPDELLDGVDHILHLAGQPGVRDSWADGFDLYVQRNVTATQRLLEAARRVGTTRFAAASSSSVYGDAETYPTPETALPRPVSPYGVTKLAAEHLCTLYGTNFGVPTVSLRYFTVYGPRQRTDMALRTMIDATLDGGTFPLFGDGSVRRSFTYVDDVVAANVAALTSDGVPPGSVCNVAQESTASVAELIELVGAAVGRDVPVERLPAAPGDATRTGGSSRLAAELLGWRAVVDLPEGIERMVAWARARRV
jgi:UDP-glucuronate 4-epimerase